MVKQNPRSLLIPIDQKDESLYQYHILQSGETVYSLSRLYGVSENEILNANPWMDVSNLSIGTEIAIPKRDFKIDAQDFVVQDTSYFFHRVTKGENLSFHSRILWDHSKEICVERTETFVFPSEGDLIRISFGIL